MSKGWPNVPLGEVLRHRKEFIEIDDTTEYKRCRVQLHAKGIVLRDIAPGAQIKTKQQQVCRAGEFLVAEIDAKVGGFGIVPHDLDGSIVSSHYFLFRIDERKLDRKFLDFFVRTPAFREQVTAQGSTNYAAIRPSHVLGYTLPLPPFPEQRRIVAKIEQLASKIEEARRVRGNADAEADVLFATTSSDLFLSGDWPLATVEEVVGQKNLRNGKSVKAGDHPDGIRCLRLSAMRDGRLDCDDSKTVPLTALEAREYLIQAGDVFVMRGNGSKDLVGRAALATESQSRTIFPDLLIRIPLGGTRWSPDFFVAYWNCPVMRRWIADAAKTTSGIWKINQGHIASFRVPIPPLPEQRRIVAYLDDLQAKVDQLKTLQAQTAAELDALLPSILDKAFRGEL